MKGAEITGDKELARALARLGKGVQKEAGKVVDATALEVRGEIVKGYNKGPATGRVYQRGNISHRASAPGEAPMTDTGRLASSVVYENTGTLSAEVHTKVNYGAWLEYGTRDIAPRPLWLPTAKKAAPKFVRRMTAFLKRKMR